jgi:hypothetical protein
MMAEGVKEGAARAGHPKDREANLATQVGAAAPGPCGTVAGDTRLRPTAGSIPRGVGDRGWRGLGRGTPGDDRCSLREAANEARSNGLSLCQSSYPSAPPREKPFAGLRIHDAVACSPKLPVPLSILTLADLNRDGRDDLVITVNDGPTRAWLAPAPTTPTRPLQLHGPPGNPHAIGARMIFHTASGTRHAAEIHLGYSYLSHSSPQRRLRLPPGTNRLDVRWPDGRTTIHRVTGTPEQPLTLTPEVARPAPKRL